MRRRCAQESDDHAVGDSRAGSEGQVFHTAHCTFDTVEESRGRRLKSSDMSSNFEPSEIRVGDAERTAALDQLGQHFANGYLNVDEFEERTSKAAVARTRADVESLFGDLPASEQVGEKQSSSTELDDMLERKKKLDRAIGLLWSVTMVAFFVGLFVLDWDYFWVVFPIAGLATWGLYEFYGISDEEDEVLEGIIEDEGLSRAERLRIEHERRKELGM